MSAGAAAAPHLAAVSPPGSVATAAGVGTTAGAFRRTAWTSLNTTRPVPSGCEILYSIRQTVTEESRTCSAGGTEGRAMRPEVAGLIAGATVTLSSALFGLAAKDTNPWFVVWVVLSATIVVGLALSVAR